MKQNPKEIPVLEDLRAGILARDGFMGVDNRPYPQIILDDAAVLDEIGVTAQELGQELGRLTKAGLSGMGEWVSEGDYEVKVEEYMGKISCPFRDHRAAKRNTTLKNKKGEELVYTDLAVHLIVKHGFFQGKGSPYRLEPAIVAAFLSKG